MIFFSGSDRLRESRGTSRMKYFRDSRADPSHQPIPFFRDFELYFPTNSVTIEASPLHLRLQPVDAAHRLLNSAGRGSNGKASAKNGTPKRRATEHPHIKTGTRVRPGQQQRVPALPGTRWAGRGSGRGTAAAEVQPKRTVTGEGCKRTEAALLTDLSNLVS